jgi:hypothetical protein
MRFSTLMMIAAVAGSVTTAAGQSPAAGGQPAAPGVAPAAPIVQIGLFGYRADGNASSMAYDTEPSLKSAVFIRTSGQNSCTMGAGGVPPDGATDIWRFTGKILSSSPEEVVVELDWRRTLAGGTEVGAPGSSQVLTLRAGDRVLLDSVTPPACWTTVGFEARYMPRPFVGTITYRPQGGVGGGGRVAGGGGIGSGTTVRVNSGSAGSGAGASSVRTGSATFTVAAPAQYDVNVWLVRQSPGKPDESEHQLLRVGGDEVAFAFPPIDVETAKGPIGVQVTGAVAVTSGASGPKLVLKTNRRVARSRADATPRDGTDVNGTSRSTLALPRPEEVLSFEMPPLLGANTPVADRFSVRLTVSPR